MLLDLNTDTPGQRAGFRLHRLEVLNWGTFHQNTWNIEPRGGNALLTGDIGSGKSTLVDAITTLLVPTRKIIYNKAAGAEGRERSLRTYVKGAFKNEKVDGSARARDVYLRPDHNDYTVLITTFFNEGTKEAVALAQVLWMAEEAVRRFYVVANRQLEINPDFSNFGAQVVNLKRRLRKDEDINVFNTFTDYADHFRRRFGIRQEEALELFYQTVSMKSVGNLTDFVRERMLGRTDIQDSIDRLVSGYAEATAAHAEVRKARRQLETLDPLMQADRKRTKLLATITELEAVREELPRFFAHREASRLLVDLRAAFVTYRSDQSEIQAVTNQLEDARREQGRLRAALEGHELYRQKQELTRQIAALDEERNRRRHRADALVAILQELAATDPDTHWTMPANTAEVLAARRRVRECLIATEEELDALQAEGNELVLCEARGRERYEELAGELKSLRGRPSAIPRRQLEVRQRLCAELGLAESELPYAGELLQVREAAADWEGAIERILHGLGLSLLVADRHYAAVSKLVNRQHLGYKLVYLRTLEHRRRPARELAHNSLVRKVRVKADSEHQQWLDEELRRRYDFVCAEDMDTFRSAERALTRQGMSKSNLRHHVKDDRFNVNDRSRYVLGWTNTSKIRTLEAALSAAKSELDNIMARSDQHRTRVRVQNDLRDLLLKLDDYPDFEQIDYASVAARRQERRAELTALEGRDDELTALGEQLERTGERMVVLDEKKENLLRRQGKAEGEILRCGDRLQKRLTTLSLAPPPPADHAVATIVATFADITLPAPVVSEAMQKLLQKDDQTGDLRAAEQRLNRRISRRQDERSRLDRTLVKLMGNFRHAFPNTSRELDASLDSLSDFRRIYEELRRDKLPGFEQKFRQLLREGTIRGIVGFQNQLDRADREIAEKVSQINEHLRDIDYTPGTYIAITREEVKTEDILSFKSDLKVALSDTFGVEEGEAYNERKFMEIKKLLDRFRGENELDARWAAKVTDVRQWYNFGAENRDRATDESREYFSDSGGKSGGQKEKLAYTILASAIAFQFGLRSGRGTDRSFRFVVIDEAFGRGSDESTRYGLRLFERLELQLLIVTPLQKINVIEDYINTLHFVSNPHGNRSKVRNLTIEEHRAERARRRAADQATTP